MTFSKDPSCIIFVFYIAVNYIGCYRFMSYDIIVRIIVQFSGAVCMVNVAYIIHSQADVVPANVV